MGIYAGQLNKLLKLNRMKKDENMHVSPHSSNAMLAEGTGKRRQLEAEIVSKKETIKQYKSEIIELERELLLLSDSEQWYSEGMTTVVEKDGRKKNKVERLIGRVHWNENFKDESTGEVITIERSQVVRVDGKWDW